jgi:hypothetical protein
MHSANIQKISSLLRGMMFTHHPGLLTTFCQRTCASWELTFPITNMNSTTQFSAILFADVMIQIRNTLRNFGFTSGKDHQVIRLVSNVRLELQPRRNHLCFRSKLFSLEKTEKSSESVEVMNFFRHKNLKSFLSVESRLICDSFERLSDAPSHLDIWYEYF